MCTICMLYHLRMWGIILSVFLLSPQVYLKIIAQAVQTFTSLTARWDLSSRALSCFSMLRGTGVSTWWSPQSTSSQHSGELLHRFPVSRHVSSPLFEVKKWIKEVFIKVFLTWRIKECFQEVMSLRFIYSIVRPSNQWLVEASGNHIWESNKQDETWSWSWVKQRLPVALFFHQFLLNHMLCISFIWHTSEQARTGHWEYRDGSRWPGGWFDPLPCNCFLLFMYLLPSQCAKVIISDCGIP